MVTGRQRCQYDVQFKSSSHQKCMRSNWNVAITHRYSLFMCSLIYANVFGSNGVCDLRLPRILVFSASAWLLHAVGGEKSERFRHRRWQIRLVLLQFPWRTMWHYERMRAWMQNTKCFPRNPFQIETNRISDMVLINEHIQTYSHSHSHTPTSKN